MRLFLAIFFVWGTLISPETPDRAVTPADSTTFQFHEESEMTVHGSSNVRDWDMDVETIEGDILFSEDATVPTIEQINVEVPVEGIVASRSSMQEKAHKALKKEDYPAISFSASDVNVSKSQGGDFAVFANGDLTIAGNTQPAELQAKGVRQEDGSYAVEGEYELKLSTFDVERPSAMLGTLTVSDEIRLSFDVVLSPRSE